MFKSARWRSEKNKVKVVFKLQFHAAKVPQIGDDALMISVVPADAGKPTVKSDKAVVRDGSCFWENPVYETVKFNREPKSGKIHERIYYFVVVTGSSKAGVIGEASIDFSHYVDATKVSLVSLPIKCSKTEATLHVSIQRMQESIDHREVEESENAKSNYKDHSLKAQLSNGDMDESIKSNSDHSEEAFLGQHLEESSDIVIEKLKSEVAALSRQAEMSELELQTLRKQIVKESKRGQDLFKELVCLKEERDGLKENVKSSKLPRDAWSKRKLERTCNLKEEIVGTCREAGPTRRPDDNNDDEEQKALEELVKEHGDAKEAYLLEQQIIDMRSEIEIYRRDKDELEMQMEQLALDYEIMKQENHEMAYKLEQSELQEQLKLQYEYNRKNRADALVTISELEAHVKTLEEELEKQSQGFEADLEALMRSKVEQEQRAIKAEETLRKTRRQNANTAERLQEEFKRLSMQMVSTFESNEKLATKALAEANELRLQKSRLEEIIRNLLKNTNQSRAIMRLDCVK
ncbi:hypothetical protein DH2020_028647 [Rehmannia glutinosa]|uniref:C2 NT-type domain-containing protein n=1 Tax=Rehmannia glutinosa TaxID=99300 RepID=A0ABR0VTU6_REHGL